MDQHTCSPKPHSFSCPLQTTANQQRHAQYSPRLHKLESTTYVQLSNPRPWGAGLPVQGSETNNHTLSPRAIFMWAPGSQPCAALNLKLQGSGFQVQGSKVSSKNLSPMPLSVWAPGSRPCAASLHRSPPPCGGRCRQPGQQQHLWP